MQAIREALDFRRFLKVLYSALLSFLYLCASFNLDLTGSEECLVGFIRVLQLVHAVGRVM